MRQRCIHLIGALAILLAIAGSSYATGVDLAGTIEVVQPQSVEAACGVGPQPMIYSGGWRGRGGISGCGTSATIQVCAQSSDGTVWGCRTWTGNTNNGVVYVTSLVVSSAHGCLVRSWVWSPYWGTQVSYYTNIC